MFLFFLIPFFIVFKISLSESEISIPPYTPVFDIFEGWEAIRAKIDELDFEKYSFIFSDELYTAAYWSSIKIAAVSTFLTLLIAYPLAYGMARAPREWQPTLMMFVILPFWTSFLIRVYAWIGILKNEGLLNALLLNLGVISEPLTIMNTTTAVYIGIVYSYLPFMVLPLYASLEKIDGRLLEAAEDLGSPPWKAFWQVTFPLSIPGIVAGCFLVFIPAVGEFVIPDLLGGSETLMIGKTLWSEFFNNRDWPVASAVAVLLLLVLIIPIVGFQWAQQRAREAGR
jgi:putrescine transport system permease protein